MNLSEMANFICAQVRYPDSDSVAKCKEFLQRRDEWIYADQLWRESIYQFEATYDMDDTLHAAGIYLLPNDVDKLIGVRTASRPLNVNDQVNYFRMTPDEFASSGTPLEFYTLPRCVWMSPTAVTAEVAFANAMDNGTVGFVRYVKSNGDKTQINQALTSSATSLGSITAIERFSKPNTSNSALTISNTSTAATLAQLLAAESYIEPSLPLRLMRKPTAETVVKVLFKSKYAKWVNDNDEPTLPDTTNLLLAMASGDMLRRGRRFGQAKEFYSEAAVMFDQLKRAATYQEANEPRFIPTDGFGSFEDELSSLTKADYV